MPSALESRLLSEGVAAEQVAVLVVKLAKTRFTTLQSLVGLDDAKLDDALIDVAADRMALLAIRDELLDAANKHSAATDKVAPSEAAPVVAAANDDTSSAAEPAAKRKRAVRPPREKKPLKEPKPPKEPKPAKKRIRLDLIPNREWGLSRTSVDFSTVEQRDEAKAEWSLIRAMPLSAFATPDMDGAKCVFVVVACRRLHSCLFLCREHRAHFQRMLEAKGFSYKIRDAKGYGWSEHEKAWIVVVWVRLPRRAAHSHVARAHALSTLERR